MTRAAARLLATGVALVPFFALNLVRAQSQSDSSRAVEFGVLIQVVAHASGDSLADAEGFLLDSARLNAEGQPTDRLAFELEADFSEGIELKDALIDYRLLPVLGLKAGHFKAPFSYGELTSSSATPFVRRPRVVEALAPGRHIGVELEYQPRSGPLVWHASVFNGAYGEEHAPEQDEHLLLYVGRVAWLREGTTGALSVAVNGAYDASAPGRDVQDGLRYGADVHLDRGGHFVTAEALALADSPTGSLSSGAYLTAGYLVEEAHLVRAQIDHIRYEDEAAGDGLPNSTQLGLGYTFLPDSPLRIEIDYLVPVDAFDLERSTLLINVQLSL